MIGVEVTEPEPSQSRQDDDLPVDAGDDANQWNADDFPAWYRDKLEEPEPTVEEPEPTEDLEPADQYPFNLMAVRTLDRLKFGPVTVLAGDNGSGKSTLIEAIAVAAGFNPEGGSRNLMFETFDTHSPLHDHLVLRWDARPKWGWFLRAETFYGMASHITQDDDPAAGLAHIFPDLHNRSHGESFLALAESRFTGTGLYMLDEPESALSVQGLGRLINIMRRSAERGSQFIVSTHSPLLMAYPGAAVYELDAEHGVEPRNFEDLTSTVLWRRFFDNPEAFYRLTANG